MQGGGGSSGQGGIGGSEGPGGAGGGGAGGTGGDEQPKTIEVRGKVVRPDGNPLPGALVFLNGDYEEKIETDAEGAFTIDEVERPYTLTLVSGKDVLHLVGLMNPEPLLVGEGDHRLERIVRLSGTLEDVPTPIHASNQLACAVAEAHFCSLELDHGTGAYSVDLKLVGESEGGDVAFVLMRHPDVDFTTFLTAGRLEDVSFQTDEEQGGLDLQLAPPIATFHTTLKVDAGVYTEVMAAFHRFTIDGLVFNVITPAPVDAMFDVPVGGAILQVWGRDASGSSVVRYLPAEEGEMEVELPKKTAFSVVRPAHGATVAATPIVEWTPLDDARSYYVQIQKEEGLFRASLPGDQRSLRLPDLSAYGITHTGVHVMEVMAIPDEAELDPEDFARAGPGTLRLNMMERGTTFMGQAVFQIED